MVEVGGTGAAPVAPSLRREIGRGVAGTTVTRTCENCGVGPVDEFCAHCGQKHITEHDLTTRGFLRESFHEITSFDGRLWRTLWMLVRHPGLLTREYFDGRGGRYMKPLNLFVLLNLVFFVIQPHTGLLRYDLANYIDFDGDVAAARRDLVNVKRVDLAAETPSAGQVARVESMDVFRVRFDDELRDQKKSFFIVSIPLLGLALLVLYAGQQRRYSEHLVFSLHTYAFFLLFAGVAITPAFVAVFTVLQSFGVSTSWLNTVMGSEPALILVLFSVMTPYIYVGLRRMYGGGRIAALARSVVLFLVLQLLIIAYHDVLFRTTLFSL